MSMSSAEYDYLCALLREETGVTLAPQSREFLLMRLAMVARRQGATSISSLVRSVRNSADVDVRDGLVAAMLNNETLFFRDHRPFVFLASALPEMIAKRTPGTPLRIWSAACSSGQEAYSLAILLRELNPPVDPDDVHLLASDISPAMLQRVREGVFTQFEVNRGLPARHLVHYFRRDRNKWRVRDDILRMVSVRRINLVRALPLAVSTVDVVLLRNVLIYFDQPTRAEVIARVTRVLRPGGLLLLGNAESLAPSRFFKPVGTDLAVCYRRQCAEAVGAMSPEEIRS